MSDSPLTLNSVRKNVYPHTNHSTAVRRNSFPIAPSISINDLEKARPTQASRKSNSITVDSSGFNHIEENQLKTDGRSKNLNNDVKNGPTISNRKKKVKI
jgi:hypothetical protein